MASFRIVRNAPLSVTVIMKAYGASYPITLEEGDTARAYFAERETNEPIVLPDDGGKDMVPNLTTPENGEFTLELTAEETALFPYEAAFNEDGSRPRPTCKCWISTNTSELQDGHVYLYDVYIEDFGL